jgi:hypothetical protein
MPPRPSSPAPLIDLPALPEPRLREPGWTAEDYREKWAERAAVREWCGGESRMEAEVAARAEVYGAGTAEAPRRAEELDLFARFAEGLP